MASLQQLTLAAFLLALVCSSGIIEGKPPPKPTKPSRPPRPVLCNKKCQAARPSPPPSPPPLHPPSPAPPASPPPRPPQQPMQPRPATYPPPPLTLDVWILAGQSNMAGGNGGDGLAMPEDAMPYPGKALQYNRATKKWEDSTPSSLCGLNSPPTCVNVTGPELSFARAMIDELGLYKQVGFIHAAQGGRSMAKDFLPPNGANYRNMISDTLNGMALLGPESRLRGMLLVQGEADSNTWEEATGWTRNFQAFLNASRQTFAQYHPELPVLMAVQSVRLFKGKYVYAAEVREQQLALDAPGVTKVDLLGLEFRVGGIDCVSPVSCVVHLSKNGMMRLGRMFAYRWALATALLK